MSVKIEWLLVAITLTISGTLLIADEPNAADQPTAVAVGEFLPAFESTDEQGLAWKSADHVGKKVLVLYFYPGDFTSGCIKQAEAYRDALAKIEEQGVELVGVSGDEAATHKLFKETYDLKHSLLADTKGELATLVGVPIKAGGRVRAINADRKPLHDDSGNPIVFERPTTLTRWTLVIGRDGKVVSLRSIRNPATDFEEVLKIVAALPK